MKNPFADKPIETKPEDVEVGGLAGLIRKVWSAPADYNRETRRRARLWGRIWAWDRSSMVDPELPPRYVRRNWKPTLLTTPHPTRRQRKQKTRILRLMKARA